MSAPALSRERSARQRWQSLAYDRWLDLLARLARAPDRSLEVRLAADALLAALVREREIYARGELGDQLARENRERFYRILGLREP